MIPVNLNRLMGLVLQTTVMVSQAVPNNKNAHELLPLQLLKLAVLAA